MAETKKTRTAPPALDFASLTVEDAEAPKVERSRTAQDNPFLELVAATYEARETNNGAPTGRSVVVPNANVGQVVYLIRAAASQLKIGSAVKQTPEGKSQTRITFAGKKPKARKATTPDAANAPA